MKVMFDTNILLDVFQNRHPHYEMSAQCMDKALSGDIVGFIPAHALTTFYYVLRKYRGKGVALDAVAWLLTNFTVASCNHAVLQKACQGNMGDFEDAVVAASAEESECSLLLTRNPGDFAESPVPVICPEELLKRLSTK